MGNKVSAPSFFERLETQSKECGTNLCIGIDPHTRGYGKFLENHFVTEPTTTLEQFSEILIDQAAAKVSSVKFQSALFECFGPEGMRVLKSSIKKARSKGLLTILDAKRGDISSTMKGYGRAAFDELEADCLTVTPYMGTDCLSPLLDYLKGGKGVYIVWRTSNPSSEEFQSLLVEHTGSMIPLYLKVLQTCSDWARDHGVEGGLGYVLGATTAPSIELPFLDEIKTRTQGRILVPGFGAQGGMMSDQLDALIASNSSYLFPISRGSLKGSDAASSWEEIVEGVRSNIQELIAAHTPKSN